MHKSERDRRFADDATSRRNQLCRTACLLCGDRRLAEDLAPDFAPRRPLG